MCSSLLGLGGTYVQQCFVCFFPPYLCAAFSCIFKSNSIFLLLSYMSYQHHAGLQPANLVTITTRSCSRRVLSSSCFFHIISSFHPVFCLFSTVYDRNTVRTSDVSYVPYEIFQNFKFNMTYCTYMFMPDFYARFTVRP